jgi:hypothetical protein
VDGLLYFYESKDDRAKIIVQVKGGVKRDDIATLHCLRIGWPEGQTGQNRCFWASTPVFWRFLGVGRKFPSELRISIECREDSIECREDSTACQKYSIRSRGNSQREIRRQ